MGAVGSVTLDEAITEARRRPGHDILAVWVRETFGEARPCGAISPEVYSGSVIITREMVGEYTTSEALAIAADVIRSVEQAQGARP